MHLTGPLEKCTIPVGSKHYSSQVFRTPHRAPVLGGPRLEWDAVTQRPKSRKNWPSKAANKSHPGLQVRTGSSWPLGQRRTRQPCSLRSVTSPLGRAALQLCIFHLWHILPQAWACLSQLLEKPQNAAPSRGGSLSATPPPVHHTQEVKAQGTG